MLKKIWRRLGLGILTALFTVNTGVTSPRTVAAEEIIFIPHDSRSVCAAQPAEVAEAAGAQVIMPPAEFIAQGVDEPGNPEELWHWLEENASDAKAAVLSTDSLLYGGLMASRKHEIPTEVIQGRVLRFRQLKKEHPKLQLYLFGSLMRTPKSGLYAGREEPDYYQEYGEAIFKYTAALDKAESERRLAQEKNELEKLKGAIPENVWRDWLGRREKNLAATKAIMDLTGAGIVDYFVVGKDDNAPFCQTHRENLALISYAEKKKLEKEKFQTLTGIDEFNLLLLTRAINNLRRQMPFVFLDYNTGMGEKTVPAFSDESIGKSLKEAVTVGGGLTVPRPQKADLVLLVNTNPDGYTGDAYHRSPGAAPIVNDGKARYGTAPFVKMTKKYLDQGYPVGIADIAFANGADNALMQGLQNSNLLGRLKSYGGWNTATNSAGFALGIGMLSGQMDKAGLGRVLMRRYLDDWGYQAAVRFQILDELAAEGHWQYYVKLDGAAAEVGERTTVALKKFAQKNIPPLADISRLRVTFPWDRMFECDIFF
ncbi:MAG: DUF4127 family protein [Selenomonadaceae bacterium]|nr:DUF4127 family protein [Selenomonadaceae bacterium]